MVFLSGSGQWFCEKKSFPYVKAPFKIEFISVNKTIQVSGAQFHRNPQHLRLVSFHHHSPPLHSPPCPPPPHPCQSPHCCPCLRQSLKLCAFTWETIWKSIWITCTCIYGCMCEIRKNHGREALGGHLVRKPCQVVSEHGPFLLVVHGSQGPRIDALKWAACAKNYFPRRKAPGWHLTNMTNRPPAAVHRDKNGRQ